MAASKDEQRWNDECDETVAAGRPEIRNEMIYVANA